MNIKTELKKSTPIVDIKYIKKTNHVWGTGLNIDDFEKMPIESQIKVFNELKIIFYNVSKILGVKC